MANLQLALIIMILFFIVLFIAYYLLQEYKFKKVVEENFNQKTNDVILENISLIYTKENYESPISSTLLNKDIELVADSSDSLVIEEDLFNQEERNNEIVPEDSMEAFFERLKKYEFPFLDKVNDQLDLIIDMVFEAPQFLRQLPSISAFSNKKFNYYILLENGKWELYNGNNRNSIIAVKLVLQLVDKEGIINTAQIINIYNILLQFVIQNNGHIRLSNYEENINIAKDKVAFIKKNELSLNLFLILKDPINFNRLKTIIADFGLINQNGIFRLFSEDERVVFEIGDENKNPFVKHNDYKLLSIEMKLHIQSNIQKAVDKLFDFFEYFMNNVESRILTSHKQLFNDNDYDNLIRYLKIYESDLKKSGISIDAELIKRLYLN